MCPALAATAANATLLRHIVPYRTGQRPAAKQGKQHEKGRMSTVPTIGVDCNVTLTNANVNSGAARGFFVKPGTYTMTRPRQAHARPTAGGGVSYVETGLGKRRFEFIVLCRGAARNLDGTTNATTARQWRDRLWAFYERLNESHTFVDPLAVSHTVRFAECEERVIPYGKERLWVLEWETRVVLEEV